MARQLRIQYEGAIYHLMSRDDLDRRAFSPRWAPPAKSFVLVAINIFSSYGAGTLQSHFGCRILLAGSLPSNPWGTDETLGIYYPQELNVVHIPVRKGT